MDKKKYVIIPKNEKIDIFERELRVAAYCRVSTEDETQEDSLASQEKYFADFIERQKRWKLVQIFYDSVSGTSRKKRKQFNAMIQLAEVGQIDLIITKEVSRFSRNLMDTLNIANSLREKNIFIWFIEDDINTENSKDMEELVTIAHQAQRESERTSRRVKWGQTQKMKEGVVFGRDMLGYKVKDGKLELVEDEAVVVKRIFELYLEGNGTTKIARLLESEDIYPLNPDKNSKFPLRWSNTMILKVLRNEKYVGDLLQKKTYTVDPLTHKKKYNNGEEDKIYIKDHHPDIAIIEREMWDAVKDLLKENTTSDERKIQHSNRYWCSGKVKCGVCGNSFVSRTKKLESGGVYKAWRCYLTALHGERKVMRKVVKGVAQDVEVGCNSESVNERVLQRAVEFVIDFIISNKEEIKQQILEEIKSLENFKIDTKDKSKLEKKILKLETEKSKLLKLYAKGKVEEKDLESVLAEYKKDEENINRQIQDIDNQELIKEKQIFDIQQYIVEIDNLLNFKSEFTEEVYKEIVDKIIVLPNHILQVYMKCLPSGIQLTYTATGKLDTYTVTFNEIKVV